MEKSIVYFVENILEDDDIFKLADDKNIQNLYIFPKSKKAIKKEKVFTFKKLKNLKDLNKNVEIILNINDNYKYMKLAIKTAYEVVKMCKTSEKNIQNIEVINNNNSKYYEDVLNCIKAMNIEDDYERNAFICDTICDIMDKEFASHNYCKFKDNACLSNRCKGSPHEKMGCCYSFEYCGLFSLKAIKNIKQCAFLQDNHCVAKNVACKLFTCKELKKQGIEFNQHDFLLIECFFSRKQHDVIYSSFFVTREDILDKLIEVEKDKSSYFMYFMRFKYRINKRY